MNSRFMYHELGIKTYMSLKVQTFLYDFQIQRLKVDLALLSVRCTLKNKIKLMKKIMIQNLINSK